MKRISIAIDGPAAAGKSTVAKKVADYFSYIYIDTGAMYRALTKQALQLQIDIHNENELLQTLQNLDITFVPKENGQLVYINGENVTEEIRSLEVTKYVSTVATHQKVREEMVARQRKMAQNGGVVMDGRDIGTHVLPTAELKIFLIASVAKRAERRYKENLEKGIHVELEQLEKEIAKRDKQDTERKVSPLKKAEDAIEIDTTSMTITEVVQKIVDLAKERAEQR